jgi:NADH:ubiquinone oxidoreductase subunit F (NADH-binding)
MIIRQPPGTDPPVASRIFAAAGPGLREHHARFGALPAVTGLAETLQAAGLTGRGGAGFPAGRKMAAVTGLRPVVIGNGAEGEPLSRKDTTLVTRAPHLVLDGLQLAAAAVGAAKIYLYVPDLVAETARRAIDERARAGVDRLRVNVVNAPDAFVAGEESAVVRRIEGGKALPRDRKVPTSTSGVNGRPTLVNNVETLAHVALIARYGHRWFRSIGDPAEPGTMLVTLSGVANHRQVIELPTGTPLTEVLARGGLNDARDLRAVLVGGYHGTWLPAPAVDLARLSRSSLARFAASPGAGIVHVLPLRRCGLVRTADIVAYLAAQAAGQCGPCRNGLPALARSMNEVAFGKVDDALLDDLEWMLGIVDGRGSCRHPDGTVRLARSALAAFATDISAHRVGRCEAALAAANRADRRGNRDGAGDA